VLTEATKDGNIPDVKNRALIYWRLLSADDGAAKSIICFGKQTVLHSGLRFDDAVLAELIKNMGSVAGVLHIVPSDFVSRARFVAEHSDSEDDGVIRNWSRVRLSDDSTLDVFVDFDRGSLFAKIVNKTLAAVGQFAFAVNTNAIGLSLAGQPTFPAQIDGGDYAEISAPIAISPADIGHPEKTELQIAIRTSAGSIFGLGRIPIEVATTEAGNISQDEFRASFVNPKAATTVKLEDAELAKDDELKERKVFIIGKNGPKTYLSFAIGGAKYVCEAESVGTGFTLDIRGAVSTHFQLLSIYAAYLFAAK
jgi:hypothetical protein